MKYLCSFNSYASKSTLLCITTLLLTLTAARADRHFTFPYESYTEEPGVIESENQIFGGARPVGNRRNFTLSVENEVEFGVVPNFELGLYYSRWSYANQGRGFHFDAVAVEPKYRLWNQRDGKLVGVALLGEVAGGRHFLGLEGRLIVDRRVGRWQAVYNLVLESEREGARLEANPLVLGQSVGLRYDVTPACSLGAELRYEAAFPGGSARIENTVFLGPTLSYATTRFYVTATPALQATSTPGEPRFYPRAVIGVKF